MKALVSVGQIEWSDVKHLPLEAQVTALWRVLLSSVDRVAVMQRRPRDFHSIAFADAIRVPQASCDAASLAIAPA